MKKQYFLICLFLVPIPVSGQKNAESVVASGFITGNCNDLIVNGTIGQLLIGNGNCGDFTIAPGFQQPIDQITTSTYDLVLDGINIHPNPATHLLNISGNLINPSNTHVIFRITDVTGRWLHEYKVNQYNGTYQIPVEALHEGVYFLTITQSANAMQTKIFIKQ